MGPTCAPGSGVTINGITVCNPSLDPSLTSIGSIINRVLPFVFGLAATMLVFIIIWGGYDMLLSAGDPEKVNGARGKITAGIIGFALLVISYLLVRVLSYVFGLGEGII